MKYSVEELNSSNAQDWNKLNEESPQGSFFHTLKWIDALDHFPDYPQVKPSHFIVYRNDEPVALCPFYRNKWEIKGLFTICALQSDPNIVVSCPDDASVEQQIVLKCKEIIRKEGIAFTNIILQPETKDFFRSMNMLPHQPPDWSAGVMKLDLQENSLQRIWDSLSTSERKRYKQIEKDGWKIYEATSKEEMATFYAHYKANMEYVHGHCRKFSFFEYLMQTFRTSDFTFRTSNYMTSYPREMLLLLLRKNETVAAGILSFLFDAKQTMYCVYAALNRNVPKFHSALPFLTWHAIRKASEMGYTTASLGGTSANPNDIHYQIKAKFGCSFEPRYAVTFPRLGALVNSAVTRLDSMSSTISGTMTRRVLNGGPARKNGVQGSLASSW